MSREQSVIGIIGGSGLETLEGLKVASEYAMESPYGAPSGPIMLGEMGGQRVAFLPRHGAKHHLAPHKVPYKANLWALRALGARLVIGTCIAGSLKKRIAPGHFVVPDQFVNFTAGRDQDSVEQDGTFLHVPMAMPYCASLREQCIRTLRRERLRTHPQGTTVVIQGPRFSTIAESRFFMRQGWDIVNMTQYPECLHARELGLCYAVLASVTDWDVGTGLSHTMTPDHMEDVLKVFWRNRDRTKMILDRLVEALEGFTCDCAATLTAEYYKR